MSSMNNLTTLIKRLEAATSRLEDIATSATALEQPDGVSRSAASGAPPTASAPELPGVSGGSSKSALPSAPPLSPAIADLDELMDQDLGKFEKAAQALNNSTLSDQVSSVMHAFKAHRQYLLVTTKAKKPDMNSSAFAELISSLQHEMGTVNDIRESNRASPYKDQLAMVSEGMGALQWIVMDGKPADYVAEVVGGIQMFGNRVLKEYKEKDQTQVAFVQSYYALFKSLQTYIRKHYASGVTWNNSPSGIELSQALKEVQSGSAATTNGTSTPAPAAGGVPPPPPPPLPKFDNPPPPPPQPAAKSGGAPAGDMGAVFDALNKGESVTSGLRKVDKSEMTHKNPALRAGGVVPERQNSSDSLGRSRSRGPETKPKPSSMRTSGPSAAAPKKQGKKELDGNKWLIENFEDPTAPIEIEVSLSQSILISRCKNTTIRLVGKANAVSIDNSARTNLIIDDLISSVDVIKCPNFALQVMGSLPTILLDQVDGAALYLSKESLGTEVFTSKCSSVNINLPPASEQDDGKECPLPEQIRSFIKNGQIVSEIVEHAG